MMKTQEFLKANGGNFDKLTEAFGIVVKRYPEAGFIVLNYNQIESPKTDPIVMECRGLIMDYYGNVVSRSFDRFFNLGEAPETQTHLDINKARVMEKCDGSLIKVYHHNNHWQISTRGTAFAESDVGGFGITFRELVLKTAGLTESEFQFRCNDLFSDEKNVTHIFEVMAVENRVVTRYENDELVYLGSRDTHGQYMFDTRVFKLAEIIRPAKTFNISSLDECKLMAETLGNLEEGFVLWQDGKPVAKIKSPAYLAVHRIRGEGLTPNRIAELVLTGETDEYLLHFKEDQKHFDPYLEAFDKLLSDIKRVWEENKEIEDQKAFAIAIKDQRFSGALFSARKQQSDPVHCFHEQRLNNRIDILRHYVSGM